MTILYPVFGILIVLILILGFSWMKSFRRGRPFLGLFQLLTSLSFLVLLFSTGLLIFSTYGYQRLTYEQPLANISIRKHSSQRFSAEFIFESGERQSFEISGDEIYIDARILKWKPWANLLGIHTQYRLDRIGGRYLDYDDEVDKQRSLFLFKETERDDLFDYRSEYAILSHLVDAKYGNAAFIPVEDETEYLLSLSISGLILRKVDSTL